MLLFGVGHFIDKGRLAGDFYPNLDLRVGRGLVELLPPSALGRALGAVVSGGGGGSGRGGGWFVVVVVVVVVGGPCGGHCLRSLSSRPHPRDAFQRGWAQPRLHGANSHHYNPHHLRSRSRLV